MRKLMTAAVTNPLIVSLLSGCYWASIAFLLGRQAFPRTIWGGLIISPVIGIATGYASRLFSQISALPRVVFSCITLYLATALFAVGTSVHSFLIPAAPGWPRPPVTFNAIIEPVHATWMWITLSGTLLVLWPLCYANHALISGLWQARALKSTWANPPLRRTARRRR